MEWWSSVAGLCLYNIFEQHNIHCSVVCGYSQPPVFFLKAQANLDSQKAPWLPHLWLEVDGFNDPLIDIYSIGGNVVGFCQHHNIDPEDQKAFGEKAKEMGQSEPDRIYRNLWFVVVLQQRRKVLGNVWKLVPESEPANYCLQVPMGEEVVEHFGIPKHKLEEFAENPSWPNGSYFKNASPGVKKLYEQVISEPFDT
eukprot:UN25205